MRLSSFILLATSILLTSASSGLQAQVGKQFPSERKIVNDAVTGVPMVVLTNGQFADEKIYQTHPQWTSDGKWIIFSSAGRTKPYRQAFAVSEETGEIIQITEGWGFDFGSMNIARKSMKLYLLRNVVDGKPLTAAPPAEAKKTAQVIELDLAAIFADSHAGSMKPFEFYVRVCANIPPEFTLTYGSALDADETRLYASLKGGDTGTHLPTGTKIAENAPNSKHGAGPGGIRAFDLQTGKMSFVLDTPFQIGHLQANPFVPGEILYCHETGGDADQRMWFAKTDGSVNKPLYVEQPTDWVTHEAVVTADEVMFNLIGVEREQRKHPTGIAVVNLRTDMVEIIGQVDEKLSGGKNPGGFWHCNGTADGKWAVGDTFGGNLWLINRKTKEMTLFSTDHHMKPAHAHPSFNAVGDRVLINSGRFTDGKTACLVVIKIPTQK